MVCIAILLVFSAPLFSQNRIVDNAGLLSSEEAANLKTMVDNIASVYSFDLVIVTEQSIGNKSPMDYADDYFDYNGFGLGESKEDGCLFLIVMGSRDYWFSTGGRGIKIFNSTAANKLEDDVLASLKNNDFYRASRSFVNNWEEFLILDAKGRTYNVIQQYHFVIVIVAWVLAFLIGFGIVQSWKAKMNTALPKREADFYIIPNSLAFTQKHDRFLYSTVTKTAKPKSSSSGGVHTGSSGRSHGGRGGKF